MPVVESKKTEVTPQKIAHAMQFVADVAKLYRKHGSPANYHPATKTKKGEDYPQSTRFNHAWKRNIRLMANRTSPFKHAPRMRCGTCLLYFVGPVSERCQCPSQKPQRKEV